MKLSDFDYTLPKELIAQYPLKERDKARLMVLDRKSRRITHEVFSDIVKYVVKDDLMVLNDTRVLRCRLKGRRPSGGKVEILLLNRKEGLTFTVLIRPSRVKIGESITFNNGEASGVISSKNEITFSDGNPAMIYNLGVMPLPPYIKREPEEIDRQYYQTVYASEEGAVAAPTAGLHFTKRLIRRMRTAGMKFACITLHVGYATFKPVKEQDITRHKMAPESFKIPDSALEAVKKARHNQSRIFAAGTTSLRALEACASGAKAGQTDLFIYPGYEFKTTDCLLTNFHLPRTTLFMLACAFAGKEFMKEAYAEAIEKKYRFYSYGDAMLII